MTKKKKILTIILWICLILICPLALIALLIVATRTKNKKVKIASWCGIGVILVLPIIAVVVFVYDMTPVLYTDFENYEAYKQDLKTSPAQGEAVDVFLPEAEELGDYEDVELYVLRLSKSYDADLSLNLIVTYPEDVYRTAKGELSKRTEYVSEPVVYGENRVVSFLQYECQYRGFDIKIVKNEFFSYCGYFGLLGFNDETGQIAWMFYRNSANTSLMDDPWEEWLDAYFRFDDTK